MMPAGVAAAAAADFWRDGYCVVRGLLPASALVPVRQLISEYIDARADKLARAGCIRDTCGADPFENRWSRIRGQVSDPSHEGPIGNTSNWGVPSPCGGVLLDERVYQLYCAPQLAALASDILGTEAIFGCGNYWIRPMTCDDLMGKYPLHQDSHFYGGRCSEPSRCDILTAWIPLVECDAHTGALQLVRGSHLHGKIPLEYTARAAGGLEEPLPLAEYQQYGDLHAEPMRPGDVMMFHNLVLHGSSVHTKADYVRWAIDLRYERAPDARNYSQGQEYYDTFPSFRVPHPASSTGASSEWREWRDRWPRPSKL